MPRFKAQAPEPPPFNPYKRDGDEDSEEPSKELQGDDGDSSDDNEPVQEFEPLSGAAGQPVKLIQESGGRFKLTSNGRGLLNAVGDLPVNLVFIFGNARSGKSFMMNRLLEQAGGQGPFKVINSATPCTAGVDISSSFTPYTKLAELAGEEVDPDKKSNHCVGFVDVEGQGDRDQSYDTLLALPLLLTSQVILFNHKGAPTVNDMLEKLAVLTRAAEKVTLGGEADQEDQEEDEEEQVDEEKKQTKFGHLHILFRDFSFKGTRESVLAQIMTPEKVKKTLGEKGAHDAARGSEERNMVRKRLKRDFMSINVWLFQQPATPDQLKAHHELPEDLIDVDFANNVQELFETIAQQSSVARLFNQKPISGSRLAMLYEQVIETLNSGLNIDVPSVFKAMEVERMATVSAQALDRYLQAVESIKGQLPLAEAQIKTKLAALESDAYDYFIDGMVSCNFINELDRAKNRMKAQFVETEKDLLRINNEGKWIEVTKKIQGKVEQVKLDIDEFCSQHFPLEDSAQLDKAFHSMLDESKRDLVKELKESFPETLKDPKLKECIQEIMAPLLTLLQLKKAENTAQLRAEELKRVRLEMAEQKRQLEAANDNLQEKLAKERQNKDQITIQLAEMKDCLAKQSKEQEQQILELESQLQREQQEKDSLTRQLAARDAKEKSKDEEAYGFEPKEYMLDKKGNRRRNWKTRFCRVTNGTLSWHKDRDSKPKGTIELTGDSMVWKAPQGKHKFVFHVRTHTRVMEFRATSEAITEEWIKYLNYVLKGQSKNSKKGTMK